MDINQVLSFSLKGQAAHFKKFYSNKSSLTYKIPTRTVLMGVVASTLKYSRDDYYELLSPAKAKFGVKIINGGLTHFECMNYLKESGGHTQVRLQLLLAEEKNLEFKVYFTHQNEDLMKKLADKIKNNKLGYGVYLGQRQFRAFLDYDDLFKVQKKLKEYNGQISTLTYKDNINNLAAENDSKLILDRMPMSFSKVETGREPELMAEVCYEENGNKINGDFREVFKVNNEYISFFTPVGRE
jgi:CRISPR-associated protein Cas5h